MGEACWPVMRTYVDVLCHKSPMPPPARAPRTHAWKHTHTHTHTHTHKV